MYEFRTKAPTSPLLLSRLRILISVEAQGMHPAPRDWRCCRATNPAPEAVFRHLNGHAHAVLAESVALVHYRGYNVAIFLSFKG